MMKYVVLFSLIVQPCFAYEVHKNVYFEFDRAENNTESIKLKKFNENNFFLLKGYADPVGDQNYNKTLSRKRAEFVKKKIISKYGIRKNLVKVTFHGEDDSPELSNRKKRRVEIYSGSKADISRLIKDPNALVQQSKEDQSDEGYTDSSGLGGDTDTLGSDVESESAVGSDEGEQAEGFQEEEESEPSEFSEEKPPEKKRKARLSDDSDDNKARYYVGAGLYSNVLLAEDRSTGSLAEWVSQGNYNLEMQYQFKYKKFWLGLQGSYHLQDYKDEVNPNFNWDGETPNLLRLSLVSDYEVENWGIGFDLDYHQTSFIYEQGFEVRLRDVFMFGVSVRGKYKWFEGESWSSRFGLKLDLPFSGSDEISPKGELGYIGFVDLTKDDFFRDYDLNTRLYYGFRNYTNNQNDQEEEILGLLFSLTSQGFN